MSHSIETLLMLSFVFPWSFLSFIDPHPSLKVRITGKKKASVPSMESDEEDDVELSAAEKTERRERAGVYMSQVDQIVIILGWKCDPLKKILCF